MRLLAAFSPLRYFSFPLPQSPPVSGTASSSGAPAQPRVLFRPRITYESAVVLARRSWTIPQSLYPVQGPGEHDAEYFLRVTRWRREHGIPDRAYVRVTPRAAPRTAGEGAVDSNRPGQPATPAAQAREVAPDAGASEDAESGITAIEGDDLIDAGEAHTDETIEAAMAGAEPLASEDESLPPPATGAGLGTSESPVRRNAAPPVRGSRDFNKPQFIDFANPLLVRLFARITGTLKHFTVVVEECLPETHQLPTSDGNPYAVELILQVGFPTSGSTS
jgi:hypothetical protein